MLIVIDKHALLMKGEHKEQPERRARGAQRWRREWRDSHVDVCGNGKEFGVTPHRWLRLSRRRPWAFLFRG